MAALGEVDAEAALARAAAQLPLKQDAATKRPLIDWEKELGEPSPSSIFPSPTREPGFSEGGRGGRRGPGGGAGGRGGRAGGAGAGPGVARSRGAAGARRPLPTRLRNDARPVPLPAGLPEIPSEEEQVLE